MTVDRARSDLVVADLEAQIGRQLIDRQVALIADLKHRGLGTAGAKTMLALTRESQRFREQRLKRLQGAGA